jgi:hypothetical protein
MGRELFSRPRRQLFHGPSAVVEVECRVLRAPAAEIRNRVWGPRYCVYVEHPGARRYVDMQS